MEGIIFWLLLFTFLLIRSSKREYDGSDYKQTSQSSYFKVYFNKGSLGEYRLYRELMKLDAEAKVLPNVYVPRKDGTTSEIDVLYIANTGLYVFESKNYGGWIYGTEKRRYWTQTFPNGTKHSFFNPIFQNNGHISALKAYLNLADMYFHSVIVFGENATIKSDVLKEASVPILKRHQVRKRLEQDMASLPVLLTAEDISALYEVLKPLAQVTGDIKAKHIETVKQKLR